MSHPDIHRHLPHEIAPSACDVSAKVASAVRDAVDKIRVGLAKRLDCDTNVSAISKAMGEFRLPADERRLAQDLVIQDLERLGIAVDRMTAKPGAVFVWGRRPQPSFDRDAPPAPTMLPPIHIADYYMPAPDVLAHASDILRHVCHEVWGQLRLKTGNVLSFTGMTAKIGKALSPHITALPALDDVQKESLRTILRRAAEELLITWCEDCGLCVQGEKGEQVTFDRDGANMALCQIRRHASLQAEAPTEDAGHARKAA